MARRRETEDPGKQSDSTPTNSAVGQAGNQIPRQTDLQRIQEESERQELPKQEQVFSIAKRVRSRLTHLPDPTHPPLGFVPGRGFDVVFPFIRLPELRPTLNGDWVQFGSPDLPPNLLYYGDNLQVLRTLPTESIDLIYIDPPFFSGEEYNVIWGDANEVRTFSDIWDGGLDTYLIWLNARLWEMRRVLKSTGSIYVHCDWHASHYIKAEMDKIFGYENFVNEIVWWYYNKLQGNVGRFPANHDVILCYAKTNAFKFKMLREEREQPKKQQRRVWDSETGTLKQKRDEQGNLEYYTVTDRIVDDVWRLNYLMPADRVERVGYPTQKPLELMQRIIEASSDRGDVVADFYCGGGAFLAAAQGLRAVRDDQGRKRLQVCGETRRWIGCDISRVAISVTLDRLVKLCEEQSGVKSNYGKVGQAGFQLGLPQVKEKVPDIRVVYVGVYPMDRFKSVDQADFERFILQCYDARQDTSDEPISGWRTQLEPVLVGPADPDETLEPRRVKAFFEACLRHLQPNTKMKARVLAWKFSPQLNTYRKQLLEYIAKNLVPKGVAMELDYVPINSQEFRERIVRKYPDASDNEFFLRFTQPPIIGEIVYKKIGPRKYRFEAVDTYSTNLDGYLVNCQWDFDYQRGHFGAHPDYILGRRELKGHEAKQKGRKFEAVLVAEHEFGKPGKYAVACRVQDNLGGEAIKAVEIEVKD
jgi:DNA modification methylase